MKAFSCILFILSLAGCRGSKSPSDKATPAAVPKEVPLTMNARDRLLTRIGDINDFSRPRPLVTLEEFFEGNDDAASIGYNLPHPPEPSEFYKFLLGLRTKRDVSDIRVQVQDLEDPDGWPSSDTIWIITTASAQEVRSWFPERLAPDDVFEGFESLHYSVEKYVVPPGQRAVRVWYD